MRYIVQKDWLLERCIWILTVFLLSSFVIYDTNSWISIILLGVTLAILVADAILGKGKITITFGPFHVHVLLFAFFCYASCLWAWRPAAATGKATTIIEILICMSVLYFHYAKQDTISELADAVMWAGYVITIYTFLFIGVSTIKMIAASGDRLLSTYTNINEIGMTVAISVVFSVHNILFITRKIQVKHLFIIPEIILVGLSGSRKALLLVGIGIVLLVLIRFRSRKLLNTIIFWAILGVIMVILSRLLLSLPIFSAVNERMSGLFALITGKGEIDSSSVKRAAYIQIGLEQFFRTPITGIGIGSSGALLQQYYGRDTYLHNNFVELLASGGIIGFLVFYSIHMHLLYDYFKYRRNDDPYLVLCVIFLMIQLIMEYGMVSYYSKTTYFYFLIFFLEARNLKISKESSEYE